MIPTSRSASSTAISRRCRGRRDLWTDAQAYNASFDVFSFSSPPLFLQDGETAERVPPDGTNMPAQTDHNATRHAAHSPRGQARHTARAARMAKKLHSHTKAY